MTYGDAYTDNRTLPVKQALANLGEVEKLRAKREKTGRVRSTPEPT